MGPTPGAAPEARPATLTPAIIILGADALLAARPALPGQLANACYAAGYSAVIPASWGDELVAAGCLREIAARGQGSAVLCACPRVADRMRRVESLLPHLLPLASPPVAAARYLRARAGRYGVHITYVGDCPGGTDPAIDRHATPGALLRSLAKRGIDPVLQPAEVEERLLRDARRFYSLPGGAPAPNWLYVEKRGYTLIEPAARDFLAEVAFRVTNRERRVVDLAPRLGCACSGAIVGQPWTTARDTVAALEPPRAVHEVLDHDVAIDLASPLEPWAGSETGGEVTVPIELQALAGMYDAAAKASAIRTVPPPSIHRSPPAGGRPAEPVTVGPPGIGRASAAVAAQPGPPPSVDQAAIRQSGATDRASGVETRQPQSTASPTGPADHRTPIAAPPADHPSAPHPAPQDAETWPGPEPRLSGPWGAAGRTSKQNEWDGWDGRPSPVRQWLLIGVCILLALGATGIVGVLLIGRDPFATAHPTAAPEQTPPANADSTSDTLPGTSADAAAPGGHETPADADTTGAGMAADTPTVTPPAPTRRRLPIRATSTADHPRARQSESPAPTRLRSAPGANGQPASVYTPGAAPIPHAASQDSTRAALAVTALPTAGRRPPTLDPTDVERIRDEISRRSQRVDSLRHVLGSLSRPSSPDSQ